jgi:hypothetical protein
MLMTSALFWGVTQRLASFSDVSGKNIGPIFERQEVSLDFLTPEDGTDMLSRNVGTEMSLDAA